jgi:hypothetical protein
MDGLLSAIVLSAIIVRSAKLSYFRQQLYFQQFYFQQNIRPIRLKPLVVDCTPMRQTAYTRKSFRKATMANLPIVFFCKTPNGWIKAAFVQFHQQ